MSKMRVQVHLSRLWTDTQVQRKQYLGSKQKGEKNADKGRDP